MKRSSIIAFCTFFGTMIFIGGLSFYAGKAYELNKWEKELPATIISHVDEYMSGYFVDSSYQYLEGHRLDIPDEISQVSWYDDKNLDLMAVFIDDSGDYRLAFTGKTISRDSLHLEDKEYDDQLHENHSEIKASEVRKEIKRVPGFDEDTHYRKIYEN